MCLQGKGCPTSSWSEAEVAARVGEGRECKELASAPSPAGKQIPAHPGASAAGPQGSRGSPYGNAGRAVAPESRVPESDAGLTGEVLEPVEVPRAGSRVDQGGAGPGTKNPKARLGGPGGV